MRRIGQGLNMILMRVGMRALQGGAINYGKNLILVNRVGDEI